MFMGLTWLLLWSYFGIPQPAAPAPAAPAVVRHHHPPRIVQPTYNGVPFPLADPRAYNREGGTGLANGEPLAHPDPMVYVIIGGSCARTGQAEATANHLTVVSHCRPS
jgi:hypothetical protein